MRSVQMGAALGRFTLLALRDYGLRIGQDATPAPHPGAGAGPVGHPPR